MELIGWLTKLKRVQILGGEIMVRYKVGQLFSKAVMLILLSTVSTIAQESNFRATVGVSGCGNCGVENPTLSGGVSGDVQLSDLVTLDMNAAVLKRRKVPGDGYSFAGDASLRVGRSLFGIGGVSAVHQTTSLYEKTSTNVFGGVGYRKDAVVLSGVYHAPDFTSPNKVQGGVFKAELFLPGHIYVAPRASLFHFKCNKGLTSTLPDKCNSSEVGVQAGFYFR